MNPILSRTAVWLVAGLCTGTTLRAQSTEVQNDFRNIHSLQPSLAWPPAGPGLDDPTGDLVPTPKQWRASTPLGGWISTRLTDGATVTAGAVNAGPGPVGGFVLPSAVATNGLPGVKLASTTFARPLVARQPTVFFGDEIGRPDKDAFGAPLADPKAYYLARPAVLSSNFYFSTDAQTVFATQAGTVSVVWNLRAPTNGISSVTNTYFVSGSANPQRGGAKRIYWTEQGYTGPKVFIPAGPIALLKVVHNNQVPEQVPVGQEFASPYLYPGHPNQANVPRGTIWYDDLENALKAYNQEGQVFVELLGSLDNETGRRKHLGSEVVQIIREVSPQAVTLFVGDRIAPHQQETPSLLPRVINGETTGFVYPHGVASRNEIEYYATRTTSPTVPAGRPTGEILFYWMRQGQLNIQWPHLYNTYVSVWPEEGEQYYTRYVRPSGAGDSLATPILLDAANTSSLVFQDDLSGQHAQVTGGNLFYTNVSTNNPTGLALIRHINGESIWFERVWSTLDTLSPGFTNTIEALVGQRINPPAGHESAIGYIHQPTGTAFDPTAYINPFVAGVDAARLGAIIPVNGRKDHNELEVWWYKKNSPPAGSTVKPLHVPVLASTYIAVWPENPSKIILASNEGSGDLPSLQGAGSIYYQNDSTKPGFNPNDEHALMLAGRAYALRDDLGTVSTSLPYVLVRYTEADARPAMRVFKVEREDTDNGIGFLYDVEAGRVLQAPMPIPLLGKVYNDKVLASREVKPAKAASPDNTKAPAHYSTFTTVDRKGTVWLYRGPHDESSTNETFRVQYYYPSQNGFFLPGVSLANQPKPGDPMPYLRDLKDGAYQGDASGLKASPAPISYRPRWPRNAPVLLLGETLTTPTRGLPAVRGQTSLEILYDQSTAAEADASSVTLIDPTVAKKSMLEDADLDTLPSSIFTSTLNGRIFFPNLPPHLAERVYVDPNEGSKGALVLAGQFKDEVFGDDYLLLNVLSDKDLSDVNKLCNSDDSDYSKWTNLVASLSVEMRAIEESTEKLGTYVPVAAANALKTTNIWNYIQSYDWKTLRKVPTASEVRAGATLAASADITSAMQWIRDNFAALVDLKIKFSEANPAEEELKNLKSLYDHFSVAKNPTPRFEKDYFNKFGRRGVFLTRHPKTTPSGRNTTARSRLWKK